ncbi:hypothetical protein EU528_11445 [Candidatus Thorarchaeota archaeon]|nr:MAG: hypothetical protein EU528_11445 [Candidatus Thorarchaeota archaeon]
MQLGTDLVILSTITTILISTTVGVYLLRLWFKQSNRLITDLPLVFGVTTLSHSCQVLVLALQNLGILEATLEFLKIRSLIISGSIIPVIGAILQIWAPRIQRHHIKILAGVTAYWWLIAIFGTSEALIMNATIPLILIAGVAMFATFFITWKTGRLKEIRSDLMIVGIPPAMASQLLRVALLNTAFFFVPDLLLAASLVITGLAFLLPNRKEAPGVKEEALVQREVAMSVEY